MKNLKTTFFFLYICIFMLLLAVSFTACKKKNEEPENIIGKWKLTEVSIWKNYQLLEVIDYSNENIIYDFQKNNKLIITGNIPDDLFVFDGFQAGENFYNYNKPHMCPTCLPGPNLQINNLQEGHYCNVYENETMMIGNDGKIIESDFFRWGKTFVKLN